MTATTRPHGSSGAIIIADGPVPALAPWQLDHLRRAILSAPVTEECRARLYAVLEHDRAARSVAPEFPREPMDEVEREAAANLDASATTLCGGEALDGCWRDAFHAGDHVECEYRGTGRVLVVRRWAP